MSFLGGNFFCVFILDEIFIFQIGIFVIIIILIRVVFQILIPPYPWIFQIYARIF